MKKLTHFLLTLACLSLILSGCSNKPTPKPAETMPQLTPQQMEEAFTKASTPGLEHKLLALMVGKWKAQATMWMDPSQPPQVSKGYTVNTLKYGGRFVEMNYTGDWMGQKFEGTGLWGYDNVGKQYQSTWYDSMSTNVMTSSGSYDAVAKKLTLTSTSSCPMTGGPVNFREVVTFVDEGKHIFEMYRGLPDGSEVKGMEIVYTREGCCKKCPKKKCKKSGTKNK